MTNLRRRRPDAGGADGGDYFLVDENFGRYTHQVEMHQLHMLRPEIIKAIQAVLVGHPDWEIEISVHMPEEEIIVDPGEGLTLHDDEIIDASGPHVASEGISRPRVRRQSPAQEARRCDTSWRLVNFARWELGVIQRMALLRLLMVLAAPAGFAFSGIAPATAQLAQPPAATKPEMNESCPGLIASQPAARDAGVAAARAQSPTRSASITSATRPS